MYVRDESFARGFVFSDVTDVAVNPAIDHVLVLQRSQPPVTVWTTKGTFLFSWNTSYLGYPHSITLQGTDPGTASVWITDMAGLLKAGTTYGHCIKKFTYYGKMIGTIGKCGQFTNGSDLDPIQFDRVTDIAFDSKEYYYITDGDLHGLNNRVLVLNELRNLVNVWNKPNKLGQGSMQFNLPHTIAIDECDRVWVTDTQNHRVQVIHNDGVFLGELDFGTALIYGLDFLQDDSNNNTSIVLTSRNSEGINEVLLVPVYMDCSNLKHIGDSESAKKLILSLLNNSSNMTMLHSVTIDPKSLDMYITMLPGDIPPMKFILAKEPPKDNKNRCKTLPPNLPPKWSTSVLLTPFYNSKLVLAQVEYDHSKMSMYIMINDPIYGQQEYLTIKTTTFLIQRDDKSKSIMCYEQKDKLWNVPSQDWLNGYQCICRGEIESMGVTSVLWQCPEYNYVNWFWFKQEDNLLWRIFLNNNTNPVGLPVLGDYTMISFASYSQNVKLLDKVYDICTTYGSSYYLSEGSFSRFSLSAFSYNCSNNLPNWPISFYLTATMLPVNYYEPLPTQVVYYWRQKSQKTSMLSKDYNYDAYLIRNNTYIVKNYRNGTIDCIQHLDFGPPVPYNESVAIIYCNNCSLLSRA
jgi:hypothetical protein